MRKNKENASEDFSVMIRKSWTWERLTESEKCAFMSILTGFIAKGDYEARWYQLHMLYNAFLAGCGYRGFNFREPGISGAPF